MITYPMVSYDLQSPELFTGCTTGTTVLHLSEARTQSGLDVFDSIISGIPVVSRKKSFSQPLERIWILSLPYNFWVLCTALISFWKFTTALVIDYNSAPKSWTAVYPFVLITAHSFTLFLLLWRWLTFIWFCLQIPPILSDCDSIHCPIPELTLAGRGETITLPFRFNYVSKKLLFISTSYTTPSLNYTLDFFNYAVNIFIQISIKLVLG